MSEQDTDRSGNSSGIEKLQNLKLEEELPVDDVSKLKYFNFLSSNLSVSREKKRFCDVTLKVGEKIFECHRVILASNSRFFVALFKDDFKAADTEAEEEIKYLSNEYVDEKSFSKLLNAMYGAPFDIDEDWIPLFTTSMFLQLTHFIDQCEQYVLKNLEKIDLTEIIVLPELKIVKNLYKAVKKHICRNFPKYYSRLAGISLEVLEDLLTDSELFVSNVKQLFDLGKNWIVHDMKNRKQHLQLVASLLKPFHTSCEQSLKIVSEMKDLMQNEYAVKICLKTLLESSENDQDSQDEKLKFDKSGSLFFIQPNDESEVLFGAFENESWLFLNEFQVPISTALLNTYDSAVANDTLYFAAERDELIDGLGISISSTTFHRWSEEIQEWIELMPPRNMPNCLIPSKSTLYLYEHSLDDYQFSFYEPMFNRWLKVAPVNYPRHWAGIAAANEILFMIGGKPLRTISSEMPTNIVEMYDGRCGHWYRMIIPSEEFIIRNDSYHRKVCFSENTLFVLDTTKLVRIDSRNKKVLGTHDLGQDFSAKNWYLTMNNPQELWIVDVEGSHSVEIFGTDGKKKTSLSHPNVFIRPILVPWL